jgi:hypothetical protein
MAAEWSAPPTRRNEMNDDFTALKAEELNMESRELSIDELDNASGGFIWIPLVVVGLFVSGIVYRAVTHT